VYTQHELTTNAKQDAQTSDSRRALHDSGLTNRPISLRYSGQQ